MSKALSPFRQPDLYARLGLDPDNATLADIVQGFKRESARWQPPTTRLYSKSRNYQAVNEAFLILRDPFKRIDYNHKRREGKPLDEIARVTGAYPAMLGANMRRGDLDEAFNLAKKHGDKKDIAMVLDAFQQGIEYSLGVDASDAFAMVRFEFGVDTYEDMLRKLKTSKNPALQSVGLGAEREH